MDFSKPPDVEAFQAEVRAFLNEAMADAGDHVDPTDLTGVDEAFERALHAACGARKYLGLALPDESGRRSIARQAAFDFEAAAALAPVIDTAATLAGQPITTYGTSDQIDYFVPRMLDGAIELCIAYTEASAGSDLGAIETLATPTSDGFRLDGTKVMVTGAHKADWCCTVARTRTDVPAREGLTMFLVDMTSPGVSVRRRPTMNGWTLDDVHFDGVRVGEDAVLGEPDGGWSQLVSAVQAERSGAFYLGFASRMMRELIDHVGAVEPGGVHLADDPVVRDRIASLSIELDAGLRLAQRSTWLAERGELDGATSSMVKVYATELLQRLAQAASEIAGLAGTIRSDPFTGAPGPAAANGRFAWEYLERVHGTISVGANELQRDLIARQVLGPGSPTERMVDLGLTTGQASLQRAIAEVLAGRADPAGVVRLTSREPGYDEMLWRELLGHGAFTSTSLVDVALACEQLGRTATPSPVHGGLVQPLAVLRATDRSQRVDGHLAALVNGRRRYALCVTEASGSYDSRRLGLRADRAQGRWVLDGWKCFVPHAASADVLLVVTRTTQEPGRRDGLSLFAVDAAAPGIQMTSLDSIGGDRQCVVDLTGVHLADDGLLGEVGSAWPAVRAGLDRATVALCADMVGAAAAALDSTIERVTSRTQWGRTIGTFQTVRHRCADMLIDLTTARDAALDAASSIDRGEHAEPLVSAAKVLCTEACRRVSAAAHQLHGGEGIHADRWPHLWYRRIKSMEAMLGDPRTHRAKVADHLLGQIVNG